MAFPTIQINNSTGSNTAASGAGPATAVTGTSATVTNGSGSISITDAVSLSGVAVDGSAAIYIATSSGRKFSKITAISGSSGAWTVTVEDTVWTAGTFSWAIGGKRQTMDDVTTRSLITDLKPGWIIDVQDTQALTSTWTLTVGGDPTIGPVTFTSSTGLGIVTSSTSGVDLFKPNNAHNLVFTKLTFTHTGSTRGSAISAALSSINLMTFTDNLVDGCKNAIYGGNAVEDPIPYATIHNNEIRNTTAEGLRISGAGGIGVLNNYVHNCGGDGIYIGYSTPSVTIKGNRIVNNGGKGINEAITNNGNMTLFIENNTIANNASDGLTIVDTVDPSDTFFLTLINNIFDTNGGYGVNLSYKGLVAVNRCNAYRNNTTAARNNLSVGVGDILLGASPFNSDYTLNSLNPGGAQCRSTGFPNYLDIGAVQHPDPAIYPTQKSFVF